MKNFCLRTLQTGLWLQTQTLQDQGHIVAHQSPDTDTPFVPDATPQADTSINLLVPTVSCDAAPQGDTSINVLAHTISSDAASPKMLASPEIFAGYPKAAPRKQTNRGEKAWKMYACDIITNDGGNKIEAVR
ncbi:hypothetical protein BgiBS90_013747 [Biomphalaria glabrata]|nr:hypothetical protein BgiBS90_013747 [Biomphalaria glabrata]